MTHDRTFVRSIHQGQTTAVQVGFGRGTDNPEFSGDDTHGWMDEFLLNAENGGVITRQFFTGTGAAMVLVIDRKGLRVVGGEDQPPAEDAPVLWDSETFDADADGPRRAGDPNFLLGEPDRDPIAAHLTRDEIETALQALAEMHYDVEAVLSPRQADVRALVTDLWHTANAEAADKAEASRSRQDGSAGPPSVDCAVCGDPARWYIFPSVPLTGPVPDDLRRCDRHAAQAAADGAKIDSLHDEDLP